MLGRSYTLKRIRGRPDWARAGRAREEKKRKEKELGRLGEFGPRGFEFKQNIFYN
jgi:hypothetical protein